MYTSISRISTHLSASQHQGQGRGMVSVWVGGWEVEPVVPGQLLPCPGVRHAHLVPGQLALKLLRYSYFQRSFANIRKTRAACVVSVQRAHTAHLACSPGRGSPSCRPAPQPGLGTPRLGRGSRGSRARSSSMAELELSSLGTMSHGTALCRNISTS